jgi:serine/threonine protein kinase/tetratricopeptide (TPR) repeat protein
MDMTQEKISARYQIVDTIGVGSMGNVYRVLDRLNGHHVALKLVNSNALSLGLIDTALDFRFALAHEFQLLASLRHPNIISVLDYGFDNAGQPYFTMELLRDHKTILEAGADLSVPRKIRLIVQMLQALLYLHRRGILHRDLKPANAMVANGHLRILDFGLAMEKSLWKDADIISGTPAYIAPEILTGVAPSSESDLYAVGVMMFELLTGRHPYNTSNLEQLIFDIMNTAPNLNALVTQLNLKRQEASFPTAQVEGDDLILEIVRKLLEKEPEKRYHDAAEVINDLSRAIGEPLPVETRETRESILQASRFVGRESEFEQLNTALSELFNNQGSVWFVHGESGVGKTRLINEFRAKALVKGALVVRGQASEQGMPYQIWREPLRRLVLEVQIDETDASILRAIIPDIEKLIGSPVTNAQTETDSQDRLCETVLSLFHKIKNPLVILLEDLHLVRSESLSLLNRVSESIQNLPIMILGNYRDDESRPELDALLPSAHRLKLKRLTREDITILSEAMLGERGKALVDFIHEETEGNAFFLIEIMRALADEAGQLDLVGETGELPRNVFTGGVQRIVQRRLNRVPRVHYPLLQAASLLGRQIDLKTLQAIAPEADLTQWLLACADAMVLEVQENEWQFVHDKIRESVNITLNYEQLGEIHVKVAAALETVYPDDPKYAPMLIQHWRAAGNTAKELQYAVKAGDYAYFIGANPEAKGYFELALTLQQGQVARIALHNKLAAVLTRLGMLEEAFTLLQKCTEEVAPFQKREPYLVATIQSNLGNVYLNKGEYQAAAEAFRRSLALFMDTGAQKDAAHSLLHLGQVYASQGDYPKAESYFEESLTIMRRIQSKWGIGQALNALGRIKGAQGEFAAAQRFFNEALLIHRALSNRDGVVQVSFNLGTLAAFQGRFDEARRWFNDSLRIAKEINAQWNIAAVLSNLGMIELEQGQLSEAHKTFLEALALLKQIGDSFGVANTHANLGRLLAEQGDMVGAMEHLVNALRSAHAIGALPIVLEALVGIARVKHQTGENALAMRILRLVRRQDGVNAEIETMVNGLIEAVQAKLTVDEAEETVYVEPLELLVMELTTK